MRIEPSGVVMVGECEVQTDRCTARAPHPVTAIWTSPGRRQVNVCRACLDEMVRGGQWEIADARVPLHSDVAVLGRRHEPVLVVETKQRMMGNGELAGWARSVRRNLLAHGGLPAAAYFMLVYVPEKAYLWVETRPHELDAPPDYELDMAEALCPYLEAEAAKSLPAWQRAVWAVAAWLSDVLRHSTGEPWLVASGLGAAAAGGEVVVDYAA